MKKIALIIAITLGLNGCDNTNEIKNVQAQIETKTEYETEKEKLVENYLSFVIPYIQILEERNRQKRVIPNQIIPDTNFLWMLYQAIEPISGMAQLQHCQLKYFSEKEINYYKKQQEKGITPIKLYTPYVILRYSHIVKHNDKELIINKMINQLSEQNIANKIEPEQHYTINTSHLTFNFTNEELDNLQNNIYDLNPYDYFNPKLIYCSNPSIETIISTKEKLSLLFHKYPITKENWQKLQSAR